MSSLSITTAFLLLQTNRIDAVAARVAQLRETVREEAEQLAEDLAGENLRIEAVLEADKSAGWEYELDWKDLRDYHYALDWNRQMMEEPHEYVEHAVPLAEAEDLLDALYEAAEIVQGNIGGHVGTAKGTLRLAGRRRGMGCLWESEKWDGCPRRTGRVSWKHSRRQQYRPVAA